MRPKRAMHSAPRCPGGCSGSCCHARLSTHRLRDRDAGCACAGNRVSRSEYRPDSNDRPLCEGHLQLDPPDLVLASARQVRGMKTKMEYTTVEKIDEQMQRLETKLQHTSVSIQEEKKILDDIKKLRQSRVHIPPGCHLSWKDGQREPRIALGDCRIKADMSLHL